MSSAKRHASLLKWDQGNYLLFISTYCVMQSLLAYCSCYFQRGFPDLQFREALNTWGLEVSFKEQQWMLSTSRGGEGKKKEKPPTAMNRQHWDKSLLSTSKFAIRDLSRLLGSITSKSFGKTASSTTVACSNLPDIPNTLSELTGPGLVLRRIAQEAEIFICVLLDSMLALHRLFRVYLYHAKQHLRDIRAGWKRARTRREGNIAASALPKLISLGVLLC